MATSYKPRNKIPDGKIKKKGEILWLRRKRKKIKKALAA